MLEIGIRRRLDEPLRPADAVRREPDELIRRLEQVQPLVNRSLRQRHVPPQPGLVHEPTQPQARCTSSSVNRDPRAARSSGARDA